MLNSLLNTSLIKDVLNIIFNKKIGLNLDLDNININGGVGLNYKHIDLDPQKLNKTLFCKSSVQGINLCITKIAIANLQIKISMSEFMVSIDDISITLMPIIHPIKQKIQDNPIKAKVEGLMDSIIKYYLEKLEVKVNSLSLHLINYETKRSNLTYANPCLSLQLSTILYSKGIINNDNRDTKNIYDNKTLTIASLSLSIEKNYKVDLCKEISDRESNTKENGVIFLIDNKTGIVMNIQYDNEATIAIGIIQIAINPLQLELLRNIIYSYMRYINPISNANGNNYPKQIGKKKQMKIVKEGVSYHLNIIMKGLSIILYENNNRSDIPKYYLFDYTSESIREHFCYYEDNYFLFMSNDAYLTIKNRDLKCKIKNANLAYVEYFPCPKRIVNHLNNKFNFNMNVSVYEDAEMFIDNNDDLNANDNVFYSVHDSNSFYKEQLKLNYNFKLINHDIIKVANANIEIGKEIVINIKEIIGRIHLCYLFKVLKVVYSNSTLLNEILFYNYEWEKRTKSNDTNSDQRIKPYDITKIKCEEAIKSTVPDINLNQSKQISSHKTIKLTIETIEVDLYFFKLESDFESTVTPFFTEFYYDSIFMMEAITNYKKKFDLASITSGSILKLQIKNYGLIYNNKLLNIKLSSINSLFNNKRLINSNHKCEFNVTKGLISPQKAQAINSNRETDILSHPLLEIDIKVSINCTIIAWLLRDMITSINVFSYSLTVFTIFNKHMMLNYNKIRNEIDKMYDMTSYTRSTPQSAIKTDDTPDHYNTLISLHVEDLNFNIKTFYDTDNLTLSLQKAKMNLVMVKNYHSKYKTKHIELKVVLDEVDSKRLFALRHLLFNFTIEVQKNNPKGLFIHKLIKPEFAFNEFMAKYQSKKEKGTSPDDTIISNILTKVVIGNLLFRPQNILSLIRDILPQIITRDNINNNNCFVPICDVKSTTLNHIDDNDIDVDSTNDVKTNKGKGDIAIEHNIQLHQLSFELKKESISNTNKEDNMSLFLELKEFNIELTKEVNRELNKYLKCTCFVINDIILHIINFNETDLKIGGINAMFCKDTFSAIIDISNDQIEIIIGIINSLSSPLKAMNQNIEISNTSFNQSMVNNMLNNSTMSTNTNYNSTLSSFCLDDNYLTSLSNDRTTLDYPREYINKAIRKIINQKELNLLILTIHLSLYAGSDFVSQIDFEPSDVNKICTDEEIDFINIEPNQFEIKSKRDEENNIILTLDLISFKIEYEMDNFYNSKLEVGNIDIEDNFKSSQVKRMMSREDIKSTVPIIKSSIEITNSFNSISVSYYEDYEVIILNKIQPIVLNIDQKSLEFILGFLVIQKQEVFPQSQSEPSSQSVLSNDDIEIIAMPILPQQFNTPNNYQLTQSINLQEQTITNKDKGFTHLTHLSHQNKKSFIYVKSITFEKSCLYITYEAHSYLFELNGKSFPFPSVQSYPLAFKTYCFNGYSQLKDILPIIKKMFLDQLPSTKLLFHFIRSLKVAKPITHIIKDFFNIFTTPYYSYKENKGFIQGLIAGVKNFIFGIVSQNVLIGEKTLKILTTLVGLTKSNKINNTSFYAKYCISEKKQKYNDYFYKS